MLTCFVVTVSVYCTFYFLFTSILFFPSIFFFFVVVARILVLMKARQKGTFGLAYFLVFGTETANQNEQDSPLVSQLDFHVAAMSQHPH